MSLNNSTLVSKLSTNHDFFGAYMKLLSCENSFTFDCTYSLELIVTYVQEEHDYAENV